MWVDRPEGARSVDSEINRERLENSLEQDFAPLEKQQKTQAPVLAIGPGVTFRLVHC